MTGGPAPESDERTRIAWHEAGHTVVAFRLGYRLGLISIKPISGRCLGFAETVPPGHVTGLEAKVAEVIVHLAGRLTEDLALPSSEYVVPDEQAEQAAVEAIASLPPDDQSFLAYLEGTAGPDDDGKVHAATQTVDESVFFLVWLEARCRRLIHANSGAIRDLAVELLARTVLSGEQAMAIINAAPPRDAA